MSLRWMRILLAVVMFAICGLQFKLFVLNRGPLAAMGIYTPASLSWLLVGVFFISGCFLGWLAITKPNRPLYGYGEAGVWYVVRILPISRQPTKAFIRWSILTTCMQMSPGYGNYLNPPHPAAEPVYRIRVKHSASSDIMTWRVSQETYESLVISHELALRNGRMVVISSKERYS